MIRHLWSVTKHKAWVTLYVLQFCGRLLWRAVVHDLSKVTDPVERRGFARALPTLASSTYGSERYNEGLELLGPALERHYENNDHHPEHPAFQPAGIGAMTLVQVVEMWCDWRAAVRRHDDGDILESVIHNVGTRYDVGESMASILTTQATEEVDL